MPQKFYITTAIHYVNDVPHIGHMYENIVADVIARHRRRMGDDVLFLTGTDEHGQRIERSAAKQGILPIELADRVVADHHRLWKKLSISYDDFIRTTRIFRVVLSERRNVFHRERSHRRALPERSPARARTRAELLFFACRDTSARCSIFTKRIRISSCRRLDSMRSLPSSKAA
ncbi:MAG: hypothetical protein DMF58_19085 [Acidobacteria bacterium]|nr:MAG: hypothetical protein DMF58_19085 [Acidobacteriota bacterium]